MAHPFDEILAECTEGLLRGESVEQCLQRYPEQALELEPLLRVAAAAAKTASAVEPRPEFKARVRHQVQTRLRSEARKPEPKRLPALRWVPRWAAVAACVALVFVFAAGGTVAASSNTVPGDTLYSVKTTAEQVQLKLTFSEAAKARLQAKFAERRAWEMARLAARGNTAKLGALAARFEAHLAKIEKLAAQIEATDPGDGERLSALKEILYANMARDLVLLDEAEAKAPWRARAAIATAKFRLMQEYEKAIAGLDELRNQQRAQDGSLGDAGADSQSGADGGSGSDGDTGYGGSAGSGQQGQLTDTGLQVQARCAGSR
ncbi:MAG: hypothetical protein JW753_09660 [Dehalococcoidia bacterium]|nr:hypothetical protein [Dehalococcoidia bacterium]